MAFFSTDPVFLADGAIYSRIREIITSAKESLTIVSPYVSPPDDFVRELESAVLRGVDVRLIFRRDMAAEYRRAGWFGRLSAANVTIGSIERLHSKIFLNEDAALVTSMNFHSSSGENSFEAGFFVDWDNKLFKDVCAYVDGLDRHIAPVGAADAPEAKKSWHARKPTTRSRSKGASGNCIRCKETIPLNGKRPYCDSDYQQWSRYKNEDYTDRYCHGCGTAHQASMKRPFCSQCYGKNKAA